MQINSPKNDRNYYWTIHSQRKLFQYGLTPNKIKRIIRYPDRKEEGVAPNTVAVMKRKNEKDSKKGEIWVMYQRNLKAQKLKIKNENNENIELLAGQMKIISAWVYPTETPKGKEIFIPDEAWEELQKV